MFPVLELRLLEIVELVERNSVGVIAKVVIRGLLLLYEQVVWLRHIGHDVLRVRRGAPVLFRIEVAHGVVAQSGIIVHLVSRKLFFVVSKLKFVRLDVLLKRSRSLRLCYQIWQAVQDE